MNANHIGEAIRKYRHEKGLSQDQLAKLSGVSYNTIVNLEKLDREVNPTIKTLEKIAKIFNAPMEKLLVKSGN